MTAQAPDLSGLLGSRLCHDLISPIGAIGNGFELLTMSEQRSTPEMTLLTDLVYQSVASAQARIRYYRVAFGASRADQSLASSELAEIVKGVYGAGRLRVVVQSQGEIGRDGAKLALLLVLCLETAMSHGGTITVRRDGPSWRLQADATRYRDLGETWAALQGGDDAEVYTPDRVQFPLARAQAAQTGHRLAVAMDETRIDLSALR